MSNGEPRETGAAKTDPEPTVGLTCCLLRKFTCWSDVAYSPANMTEMNDGKSKQLKCLHNCEKAHKWCWRLAKQMSLTSKPI